MGRREILEAIALLLAMVAIAAIGGTLEASAY